MLEIDPANYQHIREDCKIDASYTTHILTRCPDAAQFIDFSPWVKDYQFFIDLIWNTKNKELIKYASESMRDQLSADYRLKSIL
jgi:hypothetical protein